MVVLRDLLSASLPLLWIAGAFHTGADARQRFANVSARRFWTGLAVLLPLVGPGVYLVVRPAETLGERRLRRRRVLYLEVAAGERATVRATRPATAPAVPELQREAASG
jgi:hypothetical protein